MEARYDQLEYLFDGLFIGKTKNKYGLFSLFGYQHLKPMYDSIYLSHTTIIAEKGSNTHLYDLGLKKKSLSIDSIFSKEDPHLYFYKNDSVGVFDLEKSSMVIPPVYVDVYFRNGLWQLYTDSSIIFHPDNQPNKVDTTEFLYEGQQFFVASDSGNIRILDNQMNILAQGNELIAFREYAVVFNDSSGRKIYTKKRTYSVPENLTLLFGQDSVYLLDQTTRRKFKVRDLSGESLFESVYPITKVLNDTMFLGQKGNNYRLLNDKGFPITRYYQQIYVDEGQIVIYDQNNFGIVVGEKVLPPISQSIPEPYGESGYYIIQRQNLFGLYKPDSGYYVEPAYKGIQYWTDHIALIESRSGKQFVGLPHGAPLSSNFEIVETLQIPESTSLIAKTLMPSGLGLWNQTKGQLLPNDYSEIIPIYHPNATYYVALRIDPVSGYSVALVLDQLGNLLAHHYLSPDMVEWYYCLEANPE
jgi:hypothetical protein